MRESTLEKNKFDMLMPKALAYDVDPAGEYMRPGNSPAEQAFQLLRCGYDLLLHVADNAFPAVDRRTRKRGPKWIRQAILAHGAPAVMVLAQAAPGLLAKIGRLSGDEPPELTPDHHRRLYETVKSFYSLGKHDVFSFCMREFRTLEHGSPSKAVLEDKEPANEYSQALMRGENPDDDPELVAMQREYATDYFIDMAIHSAITYALPPNDRQLLEKKLVRFVTVDESAAVELRERARRAWIEGTRSYLEYARLDAG